MTGFGDELPFSQPAGERQKWGIADIGLVGWDIRF